MALSPYIAYLFGLLTVIIIIVIFYVLALRVPSVSNAYKTTLCSNLAT